MDRAPPSAGSKCVGANLRLTLLPQKQRTKLGVRSKEGLEFIGGVIERNPQPCRWKGPHLGLDLKGELGVKCNRDKSQPTVKDFMLM